MPAKKTQDLSEVKDKAPAKKAPARKKPAAKAKKDVRYKQTRTSDSIEDRRERFAREYVIDYNVTQAAIRAGASPKSAHVTGNRWIRDTKVAQRIEELQQEIARRTQITADDVVRRWWEIANVDVNELVQFRRQCCRFCHGKGHNYQWINEAEYERAVANAEANETAIPDCSGGFGFNETMDPAPDCPRCHGEGVPNIHISDTRKLSPAARALYDGVKQTKEGLEIKLRDRDKALENVAKHLGMFKQDVNLGLQEDNPIMSLLQQVSGKTLKPGGEDAESEDVQ